MDYSTLITALREGDEAQVNRVLKHLRPKLIRFLQFQMGATHEDAKDSVQEAMVRAIDALEERGIENEDRVLSYFITSSKNCYLKELEAKKEVTYDKIPNTNFSDPEQLGALINSERKEILKHCLEELHQMYRRLIEYILEFPGTDAPTIARHFGISVNNVWTRKHRAIDKLSNCYKRKSNN